MTLRIKILALAVSIGMLLVVLDLVRRKKLREEYSQLWFITWLVILFLMIWFDFLKFITQFIGAYSPVSTIFLFAFLFLIFISLHFSIVISRLTDRLKDLSQRHAILEQEVRELRRPAGKEPPADE